MERAIPTFPCRDLDSASAFYQSLGFHLGARYPTYAILQRGALELHLSLFEALEPKTNCSAAYLRLEDAQALHRQAAALGLGGQGFHASRPWKTSPGVCANSPWSIPTATCCGSARSSMRRQSNTGFAWPAPTTSPRWPRSGKPMSAKPGKPWMPATNRRSRHCSWPPRATACSGWRRPSSTPRFRPRPPVADRGRSGTGRRDRRALRTAAGPPPGPGRELVGSAEEALRSRGAGLIRAQSAFDAPLSNLFWQGLGWDADYLTFTRY